MPRYAATAGVPLPTAAGAAADAANAAVVDQTAAGGALKSALTGVDGLAIGAEVDPAGVRALLEAASSADVGRVVLVSSATVYGAWPDNPLPLSEDAPLRPNVGFRFAAARAEAERLVAEWHDAHPGSTAAVLRAAVTVDGSGLSALDRALSGTAGLRPAEASRPVQFLAAEDLASAVALALTAPLDGPYNVAPDGWVPDETLRALAGGPARVAVPERVARLLRLAVPGGAAARRFPGIEPYQRHPWVVANDRLRAAGWAPAQSNEEAFVEGAGGVAKELSPKRRQELALAGTGTVLAGAAAAAVVLVRRRRRARG